MQGLHKAQHDGRGDAARHHIPHSQHQHAQGGGDYSAQRRYGGAQTEHGFGGQGHTHQAQDRIQFRLLQPVRPQQASRVEKGTRASETHTRQLLTRFLPHYFNVKT